jgi:transposase InsO family protein
MRHSYGLLEEKRLETNKRIKVLFIERKESANDWGSYRSARIVVNTKDVKTALTQALADLKFIQSMSAKGNCYDNAPMESFFHTFKTELVYQTRFSTRAQARSEIFQWIEEFYNRERIHSSIGYKSPVAFEEELMLTRAA